MSRASCVCGVDVVLERRALSLTAAELRPSAKTAVVWM